MAESAVSFLVEKLAMLVEKEVKLLKGVHGEFQLIRNEFERMKAFLASAESSQEEDPELKVWVKQVIEVAYDTEDILDGFMLKLARDHGHGFTGYLRKIKSSIQNLKACHHISSKIADIKSRVSSIGEGHWEDAFLVEEGELVGIDEPREEIIKWLVDGEPGLEVVSILGMGGLGKTTLAGRVYDNQQVKAYFQSHAWINVSQSYKIEDILRDMIVQLHREFQQPIPQGIEIMRSTSLKQIVKAFLQQKRYIIILDDVWDKEGIDGFMVLILQESLPRENLSSLPRTRKPLSTDFEKCEGLPLAIMALGGLLFAKDVQEWEMISHSLAAELESNDMMQNFKKILSLSYSDLHYNLKSCFMYLGVFPEDCVIKCARLIRLWIAEGFVKEREGMTQEGVAQRYLKELVNRRFLAPQGIGALASLQKLCFVKAGGSRSKNTMQELGELCQLRRLGITYLKKDDAKGLCHSVEKMTKLRSLAVNAQSVSEVIDLDFLSSPPLLLRHLYIRGCLRKLPNWLPLLNNLARVSLEWSRLKSSPLIPLQNLPNLMELDLANAFDGEILVFGDRGFPKLKKMVLTNLENLRFVSMNGQAVPCLQSLSICKCRHLDWQSLLVVIRGLTLLTYIRFDEMPEEFALAFYLYSSNKMMREGVLQQCCEDVMERNPKVHFVWWEEDHWEWYDLNSYCYNLIKRRVMSRDEVLPEVS
ncbi:disease resistance protein RPM1 [Eucalyptus grandis]|uniref:disease resistance protein RPM1 n=1 Tax=Eucalyptus grandis TaxID=71139 RepID=UPI00192EFA54|nr:disease resistance protein RPM1 [Eucalyptus grandis]